jgi:hypothetical protein
MKLYSHRALALVAAVCATALFSPLQAAPLPDPVIKVLNDALQDERHAESFYEQVIAKFGEVRPFSNIINSEQRHSSGVIALMSQYGVAVPENPYETGAMAKPEAPATLAEACKVGVEAEIANRDLYDVQLLPKVKDYPDIARVLTALRDASDQKHLPAFQRCSGR